MDFVTIEDRVDRLEALFGQFMTEMAVMNKRADERQRAAEERHGAAEDRNRAAEERNRAAEERNRAAEERMTRFEKEMRASKREMDKKWGDLANKMGTIIEDILAPNLRRLAIEHFRFETILDFMIRRSRRQPGHSEIESEFDTIVVGPEAVILGDAKSTPSLEYADEFAAKVRVFFDFFPEHQGKRLIGIMGSWAMADTVVDRLTSHGLYAMRMGEDTMELANAAALETGSR